MRKIALILTLIFFTNLMAQDYTWHTFFSEDGYTRGFKNENGEVMISPKFMGFTSAKKFRNIIAVMEEKSDNKYESYYLLKNGIKVGKDSLYVWDMAFDCESEGMIRFRNQKTDKVGFFDGKGKVTIPAIYSDALPFRNNVAVIIKDAKRTCFGGKLYQKEKPCEHWTWENGTTQLIDKKNNVLINDFKYSYHIDLYSMKENDTTALSYRLTQVGANNNYYSFNNYEKYFQEWLEGLTNRIRYNKDHKFKNTTILQRIIHKSISEIYVYGIKKQSTTKGVAKVDTKQFIESNATYLIKTFLALQKEDADYFISLGELNSFIWNEPLYEKYFDDCGEPFKAKYPVLSIVINQKKEGKSYQEHFDFLKTDEGGFKLNSVSSPNVRIK